MIIDYTVRQRRRCAVDHPDWASTGRRDVLEQVGQHDLAVRPAAVAADGWCGSGRTLAALSKAKAPSVITVAGPFVLLDDVRRPEVLIIRYAGSVAIARRRKSCRACRHTSAVPGSPTERMRATRCLASGGSRMTGVLAKVIYGDV